VKEVAKSKFSLDINGNGDPNIRTFEILSTDSLLIQQWKYLVWGFENGENFSEETIYKTPEECLEKIQVLQRNPDLYKKCLENQLYIKNKYFNAAWLASYITKNTLQDIP
jgi:spore maturation protein CgeB